MRGAGSGTHVFVVGDSLTSNSLGRVLSLALTAEAIFDDVTILAFEDGPMWSGSAQFSFPVRPFGRAGLAAVVEQIRARAEDAEVVVWFSKGADPLERIAKALEGTPRVTMIADFDDNDVAIMKSFRAQSWLNAVKMNPLRRKHPSRLARSQVRLASRVHVLSFSSSVLAEAYRRRLETADKPWAIVPHTRTERTTPLPAARREAGRLVLGFVGTVRAHKGAAELVELMRHDRDLTMVSFRQEWSPPADCEAQWRTFPPNTPLAEIYDRIDFLVLPMDGHDEAALHQLPAKLVDAAVNGCPVAATPTPPILEFAGDSIVRIRSWTNPSAVTLALRSADRPALSEAIARSYAEVFSPRATGEAVLGLIQQHTAREASR